MKKNPILHNDEINLIALFKIIWDDKIKILLITLISFLAGFVYYSQTPINYLNSLTIKPGKITEFTKLVSINELIKLKDPSQHNQLNQSNQSNQINQLYLTRFINDLEDYEEFLLTIKNTKKVQEHLSKLNIEDKEKELFKFAKSLEIVKSIEDGANYIINFKWHNPEEAKIILQDTLNLATKNFKENIYLELDQILEFEKKLRLNKDRERLDYLKEQSAISKELNIEHIQKNNVNLHHSNVPLSIDIVDNAYYLRGYKAIDKEIELIENRDYQTLTMIEQEINYFKAQNTKLKDYNIYLMDVELLKSTKLSVVISTILGLIVGIFYALTSNAFQPKKEYKRN